MKLKKALGSGLLSIVGAWWLAISSIACTCNSGHKDQAAAPVAQAPAPQYKLVTAEEWGSTPTTMPADAVHTPQFVTIHHAGELWKVNDEPVKKLKALQKYGQAQKNWPDLPYHYLIAPDGTVYEGRPVRYKPDTNTTYVTSGHIGIMLWGNFQEQRASLAQIKSAVYLTADLCKKHNLSSDTIGGHMDRAQTACPGLDLYRYIQQGLFKKWVEEAMLGGTPDIKLLDALPNGPTTFIGTLPATQPTNPAGG